MNILSFCFWQYYMHLISCEDRSETGWKCNRQNFTFSLTLCKCVLSTLAEGQFERKFVYEKRGNIIQTSWKLSRRLLLSDIEPWAISCQIYICTVYRCIFLIFHLGFRLLKLEKGWGQIVFIVKGNQCWLLVSRCM